MGLKIIDIAGAFPESLLLNSDLSDLFLKLGSGSSKDFQRVVDKVQIFSRHVADKATTGLDLAAKAACQLRDKHIESFSEVDYLIHCTQSPDYLLPTTACLLQARLGLPESIGALDVNLGCSGFVYCLGLADALLCTGHAKKILITTADTYTHYIHPNDITNRLIFGDAAAATLVEYDPNTPGSRFSYFTDGFAAKHLILENGGSRNPGLISPLIDAEACPLPNPSCLYMNGAEVFKFGITQVPALLKRHLESCGAVFEDYDWFVPHQANAYMISELMKRIKCPSDKLVKFFESIGNTVSASIPLAIEKYLQEHKIKRGSRLLLAGFGVGFSAAVGDVEISL